MIVIEFVYFHDSRLLLLNVRSTITANTVRAPMNMRFKLNCWLVQLAECSETIIDYRGLRLWKVDRDIFDLFYMLVGDRESRMHDHLGHVLISHLPRDTVGTINCLLIQGS